jgi:hypothetical protein
MTSDAAPERVTTTIHFPRDVYQDLCNHVHEKKQNERGVTNSRVVTDAVRQYLAAVPRG